MILSLVIGDGCLFTMKRGKKLYGGLTIDHGIEQSDYQTWKAQLLSQITGRNVRLRTGHKGKSVQISVCMKRFRSWRKFCYPNGKKDVNKILKFINNPTFALAVWLMDDGYVDAKQNKSKSKTYSARFRIFNCETPFERHVELIQWFKENFNVEPRIKELKKNKKGKSYPFMAFTTKDSLILWKEIREFVFQFKSMRHKFRHIEHIYQKRMLQCVAQT